MSMHQLADDRNADISLVKTHDEKGQSWSETIASSCRKCRGVSFHNESNAWAHLREVHSIEKPASAAEKAIVREEYLFAQESHATRARGRSKFNDNSTPSRNESLSSTKVNADTESRSAPSSLQARDIASTDMGRLSLKTSSTQATDLPSHAKPHNISPVQPRKRTASHSNVQEDESSVPTQNKSSVPVPSGRLGSTKIPGTSALGNRPRRRGTSHKHLNSLSSSSSPRSDSAPQSGSPKNKSRTDRIKPTIRPSDEAFDPPPEEHPKMFHEPPKCPVSPSKLETEVDKIYNDLERIEQICIVMDNEKTPPGFKHNQEVSHERWKDLIAAHRTLLYEHHDFLLASQHPAANSTVKALASERHMPLRLWRHGIHTLLEVFRRDLPESLEFMMSFIYLAYHIMALMVETIHSFRNVWSECLADLARYRMAIEATSVRERELWGQAARYWYSKASDSQPGVGRLYHHLGILAREERLQQLGYYAKSLTCVWRFPGAQSSLIHVLKPALEDPRSLAVEDAERSFIRTHALMQQKSSLPDAKMASEGIFELLPDYLKTLGVRLKVDLPCMAVVNIAAQFDYGADNNALRLLFTQNVQMRPDLIRKAIQDLHSSEQQPAGSWLDLAIKITLRMLDTVLSAEVALANVLPYLHITLVFFKSVISIRRLESGSRGLSQLFEAAPWTKIADAANRLSKEHGLSDQTVASAGQQRFLKPAKGDTRPLPEDYVLRGLVWCQNYFPEGWLDDESDDESRTLELASTDFLRAQRVLWLACHLAQKSDCLSFDSGTKVFSAP